jgi:hypothetical protein
MNLAGRFFRGLPRFVTAKSVASVGALLDVIIGVAAAP